MSEDQDKSSMVGVNAWLLQITQGIYASVCQFELVHIIDDANPITIPKAPDFCNQVAVWNDHVLPVVNIASWLSGQAQVGQSTIAVVTYENEHKKVCYGGLALSAIPYMVTVNNSQEADLPDKQGKWPSVAISCFMVEHGKRVPILDLAKLFVLRGN